MGKLDNLLLTEDKSGFLFLYHPNYGGFGIDKEIVKELVKRGWEVAYSYEEQKEDPSIKIFDYDYKSNYDSFLFCNLSDFEQRTNKDIIESVIDIKRKKYNRPDFFKDYTEESQCFAMAYKIKIGIKYLHFNDLIGGEHDGLETPTSYQEYKID